MRCGAAEAYFAHPERRWVAWRGLVPWWSRGGQILAVLPRIVARCFSNLAAVLYARMLTDDDRGTIK